jgi:hypothetical protein
MPRRKTHVRAGVISGGVVAAYRARNGSPASRILEAVGGMLGGWVGGQMPDELEPASLGGCHRSFCHSWSALIAGVQVMDATITGWERQCRKNADIAANRRKNEVGLTDLQGFFLLVQEMAWRIAAGILAGLITGYGSHLALDAFTPQCLPLLA